MPLPRLESSVRVGDQVFEALRAAITAGELQPGFRLRIRNLADELGTSVMPVREAIKRLEELGLVDSLPYRGAVVRGFTYRELLDLYSVRRLLETQASALGAPGADAITIERMEAARAGMARALDERDASAYLDKDEQLLAALYEASGNPVLLEVIRSLWSRCRVYKLLGARSEIESGDPSALLSYQDDLLVAVRAGDGERAGAITAESLDVATERIHVAIHEEPAGA